MRIPPFRLERYFALHEFSAPYLLSSSDCESFSVRELLSMAPDATDQLNSLWLGYTESSGNPHLREEISKLYENIEPRQILIHSGAQEAIFNFMNATLSRGDHIIVHWPCYQSLFQIAESIGCEVTKWVAREENNWELDVDSLGKKLRSNTKAVVVNCPHNPTGYLMSKEKFQQLNELSKDHGFIIFSDEVYRFLEHDEKDRLAAACDLNETAVSLGVLSKTFGLAGLRIGWIATRSEDIYNRVVEMKDYTTICNSAPSELLAAVALRHKEKIIYRNRNIVLGNIKLLDEFFARHKNRFNWRAPKAGPIAFPLLADGTSIYEFCEDVVARSGVMLLPGTVFDDLSNNFRIGFGRKNLPQCIERFDAYLQSSPAE